MEKQTWTILGVALVVAVIASVISASITGNVIKVQKVKKGTDVYTKAEIDAMLAPLKVAISANQTELYFLRATSFSEDTSIKKNYATIENIVTGKQYSNKKTGDTITIGNVQLTVGKIDYNGKSVELSIRYGGYLDKTYKSIVFDKDTDYHFIASVPQ